MVTAVGYPVFVRGFRLALTVEGLKSHAIDNYIRDVERCSIKAIDSHVNGPVHRGGDAGLAYITKGTTHGPTTEA